ncbi:hypothetical protein F5Y19DRAFT_460844 [Xylariaceae sp. FL1651]|nr:hypothetical protein F5Y19DRAFT_460844 [Xylariaceae sp. FL1651]
MRAQISTVTSALVASVVAHPTLNAIARKTATTTWKALSWSTDFALENWASPYYEGPDGYIKWTATWDVFADTGYIAGLPGFAVQCSGSFNDNNGLVGAWTLCSGFPGDATVEGQLLGPDGNFLANVRHNVTQNGKTTVVIGSGPGAPSGSGNFEFTIQSAETTA